MPRHNENARPRGQKTNYIWRMADLRAMSEHIEKLQDLNSKYFRESPCHMTDGSTKKIAILKTTGESIVREHRNSVANRIEMPSIQRVYKAPWYKAINLNTVFDLTCAIAVCIAIAVIFGLIIFGPFTVREFWK